MPFVTTDKCKGRSRKQKCKLFLFARTTHSMLTSIFRADLASKASSGISIFIPMEEPYRQVAPRLVTGRPVCWRLCQNFWLVSWLERQWVVLAQEELEPKSIILSKSWPYGKNPITKLHFYCPDQIQDLSQVWNSKPRRCSWVGRASFEGPSLEQLNCPTWVPITPRDMSSLWSRLGHLLQRK